MHVEQSVVSPTQFVTGVCDRNRKFYLDPRGRGALKDLQQVFSHTWLYVAELLQNAIDVEATEITMRLMPDGELLFEHNGRAFSEENVEALCARGVSSKGAGTIGFMGVGFKSVFRSFETVQVSSGDFRFRLTVPTQAQAEFGDLQRDWLGAVLPAWDDAAESPSDGMTCRFVFSRRLSELAPTEDDLEHVLGDDECLLALLAWQGIQAVDWNGTCIRLSRNESSIESADNEGERQLFLEASDPAGNCRRRWIMFAKRDQPSRRAIARFLEHRQIVPSDVDREQVYGDASRSRDVAVFCELDADGIPCPVDHGAAFALLPTGITFPIGLHVHADWLLVVTRREMMQVEGNQWQEEILSQIPRLLACFLKWLVTVSNADEDSWTRGYDVLPGQLRGDEDHDRWFASDAFRDGLRSQLRDLPFVPIPTNDGKATEFLAPNDAVVLPRPLATAFAEPHMRQRVLFGNHVACSRLLGRNPSRFSCGLLLRPGV